MHYFIIIFLVVATYLPTRGQAFNDHYRLSFSLGVQEQDRRMFGFPPFPTAAILEREDDLVNWQFSLGLHKPLLQRYDFSLDIGAAYSVEVNTFGRPFSQFQFGIFVYPLYHVETYRVHQIAFPINLSYRLFSIGKNAHVVLGGSILPTVHFLKAVNTEWKWKKLTFRPYSLEVNPGIGFRSSRWELMLSYRAYQLKQFDPVVFEMVWLIGGAREPMPAYETHNPHKLWLSLSYDLGADFSLRGLLRREK